MIHDLLDPNDPPERQTEKLVRITEALMRRMERNTDTDGAAYAQFQRAAMLEQEVQARDRLAQQEAAHRDEVARRDRELQDQRTSTEIARERAEAAERHDPTLQTHSSVRMGQLLAQST